MLFFSRSFRCKGGVVNYSRILLEEISPNFQVDHQITGNRPENNNIFKKFLFPVYDTVRLIYKLFRYSYDIIHLNPSLLKNSIIRDSFYLLVLNIFGYSSRTVIFFRGWDENIIRRLGRSVLLKGIFLLLYQNVGKILVLATSFKQQLIELGIKEERVMVTTTMYKRSKDIIWENKNNGNGMINVLFMSRFVKNKGLNITCRVMKLMVESGYKNVRFILAGEGPEENKLYSFIDNNKLNEFVSLTGYVAGKLKNEVLAEGDIFLFPTKYVEGLPNAILEAMGAGLAIISTYVGGIPEVVEDGVNGFLHDSDDPRVFFNSVKKLIDNRHLLKDMQKRNRLKAENNYEASIVAKKIEGIYREIIKDDR